MKLFNLQSDPHLKKQKNEMKINPKNLVIVQKKFQIEWLAKLPWANSLVAKGGFSHYEVYGKFVIKNKETIMGCKWDTLTKHQRHRIVV